MSTVTIDKVKEKLLTLDQVRERLAATEPLSEVTFPLRGPKSQVAHFTLQEGWAAEAERAAGTDPIEGTVRISGTEYVLTKDAFLEATSLIGLPKKYAMRCPTRLLIPHVNYWFREGPGSGVTAGHQEMKMLAGGERVLAFTKASIQPFSNLRLLDETLAGIQARYGEGEVFADYKFEHTLRNTAMRLIIPEEVRHIRPDDPWSAGIQIHNSLAGERPLSLEGYLFRYWCTNGATSTHAQSGKWNRRTGGQGDEVFEWARVAVDEILGGLEHEFEALDELANSPIETGDDGQPNVTGALQDVFETYDVPQAARESIIENMTNSDDLTMYGIMQAVTQAANSDTVSESAREALMEIGGDIPRANSDRCNTCRRITR